MPISRHYQGHGAEVMSAMKRTYGDGEKAKRVFYATEQKRKSEKKRARKRGGK
jgi:hypothetical protein